MDRAQPPASCRHRWMRTFTAFERFQGPSTPMMCSLGDLYRAARIAVAKDLLLIVHAEIGDVVDRARADGDSPAILLSSMRSGRPRWGPRPPAPLARSH